MFGKNKKINRKNTPLYFIHIASYGEYNEQNFRISEIFLQKIDETEGELLGGEHNRWSEMRLLKNFKNKIEKIFKDGGRVVIWDDGMVGIGVDGVISRIEKILLKGEKWRLGRIILKDNIYMLLKKEIQKYCFQLNECKYIDIFRVNLLACQNIKIGEVEKVLHPGNNKNFRIIRRSIQQKGKNFIDIYNKFCAGELKYPEGVKVNGVIGEIKNVIKENKEELSMIGKVILFIKTFFGG